MDRTGSSTIPAFKGNQRTFVLDLFDMFCHVCISGPGWSKSKTILVYRRNMWHPYAATWMLAIANFFVFLSLLGLDVV